ncbi:MAG: RhuM family protein [Desulfobacteraceae bacterium]
MENQIEIYTTQDNETAVEVRFDQETVWLTQAQMADLFERNRVAITQHIGNIFKEGELDKKLVCKDFLQTTQHGAIKGKTQSRKVKFYNLDVIISVGYRVKSKRGTQFR